MSRIPVALQAVFLASNRGQEVHKPPPGKVASRVFSTFFGRRQGSPRGWFRRRRNSNQKKKSPQLYEGKGQKQHRSQRSLESSQIQAGPLSEIFIELDSSVSQKRTKVNRKKSHRSQRSYDEDSTTSPATFVRSRSSESNASQRESVQKSFTPQSYLDAMLQSRGYSITRFHVLHSGYNNKSTPLQQLSYHVHVIDLVKSNQIKKLQSLFSSGLSTNPANVHGEGLINLVCRLGAIDVLKTMIEAGCDIQVSDDYGRTPMHDACWATTPAFDVVELLLGIDPCLMLMMDVRGALPLSYIQEKDHDAWIGFLTTIKDTIWPPRLDELPEGPPPLTLEAPNSRPVPNPSLVLPNMFIQMLASGRMSPEEIALLHGDDDDDDEQSDEDEDFHFDYIENGSIGRASFGGYTFNFSEASSDDDSSTNSSFSSLESDCDDETDVENTVAAYDKCPKMVNRTRSEARSISIKEEPNSKAIVMPDEIDACYSDFGSNLGRTSSDSRRLVVPTTSKSILDRTSSGSSRVKPRATSGPTEPLQPFILNIPTDKCPKSVNRTRSHESVTFSIKEDPKPKSIVLVDGFDVNNSEFDSKLARTTSDKRRPLTPATSGTTESLHSSSPSLTEEPTLSGHTLIQTRVDFPESNPFHQTEFLLQQRQPAKAKYCTPECDDGLLAGSC